MEPVVIYQEGPLTVSHQAAYQGNMGLYIFTVQTPAGPLTATLPDGTSNPV